MNKRDFYLIFLTFIIVFISNSLLIYYFFSEKRSDHQFSSQQFKYEVPTGKPLFFGNPDKDGSWRIVHNSNDIIIQKQVDGVWSSKFSVTDSITTDVLHATDDVEIGGTSVITSIIGSGITVTKDGNSVSLTVTQGNIGISSILETSDTPDNYSTGKLLISTGSGFEWNDLSSSGVSQEIYNNIANNGTVQVIANTVTIEEKVTIPNNNTTDVISDSDSSKWDYEDAKGSITQFIVDIANTSGHFTNGGVATTLGLGNTELRVIESVNFKLEGDSNVYAISSITDDGEGNGEVAFELNDGTSATINTGTYNVEWISGINMKDNLLKMVEDGSGDGNDSDTVLLIHSDTTDGSQLFTDSSVGASSTHEITPVGDIHHESTNALPGFGNTSIQLDGTSDYLSFLYSEDFNFASTPFAIDFWIKTNINTKTIISFLDTDGSTKGWLTWIDPSGIFSFDTDDNTTHCVSTSAINDNNWHYIAISFDSSNIRVYIDGTLEATTSATNIQSPSVGSLLSIGSLKYMSPYYYFTGYLDEIRITKGTNRGWTGSSITVPTKAYGTGKTPVNQFYTAITNDTGQFNTSTWTNLNSGIITESLNGQIAYYSLSFDDRSTFQIYKSAIEAWRNIVRDNSGTWQYNNGANGSENWVNCTINEMAAAVSGAVTISENQMTAGQFNAITGGESSPWIDGWNYTSNIDLAVSLKTITSTSNPEVSSITFNNDEAFTRIAAFTDGIATGSFTAEANEFTIGTRTWTIKNVSGETKSIIVNKF
ncbi:hypothetical protein MHK_010643 [Candidatus Magnetomorum sp. HK-1]|nr:hypothetical protein MHK_010643 [Candidatus Magnetomorum sp. HK-1]